MTCFVCGVLWAAPKIDIYTTYKLQRVEDWYSSSQSFEEVLQKTQMTDPDRKYLLSRLGGESQKPLNVKAKDNQLVIKDRNREIIFAIRNLYTNEYTFAGYDFRWDPKSVNFSSIANAYAYFGRILDRKSAVYDPIFRSLWIGEAYAAANSAQHMAFPLIAIESLRRALTGAEIFRRKSPLNRVKSLTCAPHAPDPAHENDVTRAIRLHERCPKNSAFYEMAKEMGKRYAHFNTDKGSYLVVYDKNQGIATSSMGRKLLGAFNITAFEVTPDLESLPAGTLCEKTMGDYKGERDLINVVAYCCEIKARGLNNCLSQLQIKGTDAQARVRELTGIACNSLNLRMANFNRENGMPLKSDRAGMSNKQSAVSADKCIPDEPRDRVKCCGQGDKSKCLSLAEKFKNSCGDYPYTAESLTRCWDHIRADDNDGRRFYSENCPVGYHPFDGAQNQLAKIDTAADPVKKDRTAK